MEQLFYIKDDFNKIVFIGSQKAIYDDFLLSRNNYKTSNYFYVYEFGTSNLIKILQSR